MQPHVRVRLRRFFDAALTVMGAFLVAPITLIIVVWLSLSGQRPFLLDTFRTLKLRTMVPNADERLKEFLQQNQPNLKSETLEQLSMDKSKFWVLGQFLRFIWKRFLRSIWNSKINNLRGVRVFKLKLDHILHFVMTPEEADTTLDVLESIRDNHSVRFGSRYAAWRFWTWGLTLALLAIIKKSPFYRLYSAIVDRLSNRVQ